MQRCNSALRHLCDTTLFAAAAGPEGLFIERAHDPGIAMREWSAELLSGDPVQRGAARCHLWSSLSHP